MRFVPLTAKDKTEGIGWKPVFTAIQFIPLSVESRTPEDHGPKLDPAKRFVPLTPRAVNPSQLKARYAQLVGMSLL